MASYLTNITKTFQKLTLSSKLKLPHALIKDFDEVLPKTNVLIYNSSRNTNYFNKCTENQDQL